VTSQNRSELSEALRPELARRLTETGWVVDVAYDAGPGGFFVGAFRRQITDDFWVTIQFMPMSWGPREDPLWIVTTVGVSYFPAYCIWPILVDRERSEVTADLGELVGDSEEPWIIKVARLENVPRVADQLVAPVVEHAMTWAQQYASVDALIEHCRADPDRPAVETRIIPVLLAASGDLDGARSELAAYLDSDQEEVATPEYRRFCYKFNRWLDAGAVIPEPPSGPVGARVRRDPGSTREERARDSRIRRQTVGAVRRQSSGKSRGQLKEMLRTELDRRGVKESPVAIEMALDSIEASSSAFGRAKLTMNGLKLATDFATGLYRIFRDPESHQSPDWLQLPARASYDVRGDHRNAIGVDLDPGAQSWLDQVLNEGSTIMGIMATMRAWLAWDPEPQTADSRLAVHIGAKRVGVLSGEDAALFQGEMDVASHSDELPFTFAGLFRWNSPPKYVLEIWAPSKE
jgi:hypothetical protein